MGINGEYSLSPQIIPLFLVSELVMVSFVLFMLFLNSAARVSCMVRICGNPPSMDCTKLPTGVFEPESGCRLGLSGL